MGGRAARAASAVAVGARAGVAADLRRAADARGEAALDTLGAAAAGAAQVVLARALRDRGQERVRVRDGQHRGDVAEAERGDQRGLERLGERIGRSPSVR